MFESLNEDIKIEILVLNSIQFIAVVVVVQLIFNPKEKNY